MAQTVQDAVRILREYTGPQITGNLIDEDGYRCAMGVLGGSDLVLTDDGEECWRGECDRVEFQIGEEFGLMQSDVEVILDWNDGTDKCSFQEIASRIEDASAPAGEWCEESVGEVEAE